jgi:hypothetical protein
VNNRQLAQTGLGLLGVWALLSAAGTFIQIAAAVGMSFAPLALAEVIPVAILLSVSYLLIFHNAKVATAIFPDIDAPVERAPSDVTLTLVALTGVLLLVQAAPSAANNILAFLSVGASDPGLRGQLIRRFIASLIPIGAGIYLITRPGRFVEFLQRPSPEHAADLE